MMMIILMILVTRNALVGMMLLSSLVFSPYTEGSFRMITIFIVIIIYIVEATWLSG